MCLEFDGDDAVGLTFGIGVLFQLKLGAPFCGRVPNSKGQQGFCVRADNVVAHFLRRERPLRCRTVVSNHSMVNAMVGHLVVRERMNRLS